MNHRTNCYVVSLLFAYSNFPWLVKISILGESISSHTLSMKRKLALMLYFTGKFDLDSLYRSANESYTMEHSLLLLISFPSTTILNLVSAFVGLIIRSIGYTDKSWSGSLTLTLLPLKNSVICSSSNSYLLILLILQVQQEPEDEPILDSTNLWIIVFSCCSIVVVITASQISQIGYASISLVASLWANETMCPANAFFVLNDLAQGAQLCMLIVFKWKNLFVINLLLTNTPTMQESKIEETKSKKTSPVFKCETCSAEYKTTNGLKKHIEKLHTVHECDCDELCKILTHNDIKYLCKKFYPDQCSECSMYFTTKSSLSIHKRTAHGICMCKVKCEGICKRQLKS